VGDALTKALNETGKCEAVNLTGDITKAHGAMVEDAQATAIGPQFEVQYLCIVLIRDVKGKTFNMGISLADASRGQRIASGSAAIDLSDGPGMLKAMAKMALELTAGIVANVVLGPSGGGAGAGSTPTGQPVQQAASGQPARTVAAVYMSGEEPTGAAGAHMVIGEELAKAMSKGGNKVVNHTEDIRNLSAEERGDTPTKTIGQRFGIPYVCVVKIKEVSGNSYYLNARMVNTETDETVNTATVASNLSNSGEMAEVAQVIARELSGGIAFTETVPQVEETMPVQQAQGTGSAQLPPEVPPSVKRNHDYYFAARYALPLGISSPWGAVNVEGGLVWGNGTFSGIDFNFGFWDGDITIGGTLSLGGVYDLPNSQIQLVYGGSAGFLLDRYGDGEYYTHTHTNINFLGPFIKLRWKSFELSYRGLLGIYNDSYNLFVYEYVAAEEFGWNNHQIMLGVYFATSKRVRK
jgi:hypothetical protein